METILIILDVLVKARGQSLVDRLITQLPKPNGTDLPERRALVLRAAVTHLWDIHVALIGSSDIHDAKQTLYNPKYRRVIDGLLDLISLEGIYPALSLGVGIPIERRVKSVLQAGVAARYEAEIGHDRHIHLDVLKEVVNGLSKIVLAGGNGVNSAIRERNLVDIICGCGELAYGNSYENTYQSNKYRVLLEQLLDEYVKTLTVTYASFLSRSFRISKRFLLLASWLRIICLLVHQHLFSSQFSQACYSLPVHHGSGVPCRRHCRFYRFVQVVYVRLLHFLPLQSRSPCRIVRLKTSLLQKPGQVRCCHWKH